MIFTQFSLNLPSSPSSAVAAVNFFLLCLPKVTNFQNYEKFCKSIFKLRQINQLQIQSNFDNCSSNVNAAFHGKAETFTTVLGFQ